MNTCQGELVYLSALEAAFGEVLCTALRDAGQRLKKTVAFIFQAAVW